MLRRILKYIGGAVFGILFILIVTILLLRWLNPPFTSFTLQADWESFDRDSYNLRATWITGKEIPEHMIWAVVASEDQLFFEHYGFDFESMQEAWEEHQEGVRTRGASTITQQVAKNLFLAPTQSFIRKGIEAGITVLIEFLWPKERIIEVYLNIAEFGPGIFGIGKASQQYFNRSATELTPEMAARFAAVLPNPKRMRVNPPSPYAEERSRWILRQMTQLTGNIYYKIDTDTTVSDQDNNNLKIQSPDSLPPGFNYPDTIIQTDPPVEFRDSAEQKNEN